VDTSLTSDAQLYAAVVGFFLPLAISVIQRQKFSTALQAVLGFLCVAAASAGTTYFTDGFDGGNYVHALLIVFVATITAYHGFWKPTGVAPKVEKKTGG